MYNCNIYVQYIYTVYFLQSQYLNVIDCNHFLVYYYNIHSKNKSVDLVNI